MAAITGKKGKVMYGGVDVFRISRWALDVSNNVHDVTVFTTDNVTWRTKIHGLNEYSGSIAGFWDMVAGSTAQRGKLQANILTPSTGQVILYVDSSGGENYRGSVLLNRQSVNADIDGTIDAAWDFMGTGALTYSTAT